MENTPQPSCSSQVKNNAIELARAIEYGFDMQHPQSCPAPCHWDSDRHGAICPYGGCVGMKIEPPVDPEKYDNLKHARLEHEIRAAAGEEIAAMLMEHAKAMFVCSDDEAASSLRAASLLCHSWAASQRELQTGVEKELSSFK